MLLSFLLLGIALLLRPSECLTADQYCGDAVQTTIGSFAFNGSEPDDYWGNLCTNELGYLSIAAGIKTYCSAAEVLPGWAIVQEYCLDSVLELPEWDTVLPDLTDDAVQSFQVVEFEDIDPTKIWDNSVLLSESLYTASYRTTTVFEHEYTLHQRYGWAMYGFWGIILLTGMINHAMQNFIYTRTSSSDTLERGTQDDKPSQGHQRLTAPRHWIQRHLSLPPLFQPTKRIRSLTGTPPARLETIILASYWIINLVLCCVSYEIFYPNLYYTESLQTWRYIADRTGILSYANLPWLWMFSGRNNIFIPLTGWSFSTFNVFHRHIACVATIQAIVHSVAYTVMEVKEGGLAASWQQEYWYMGGLATIAMSLMLGLSHDFFRRHTYEFFLLAHIGFAVLVLVGLFYHTAIFEGEYNGYLWPLVAIWVFDRLVRLVRLLYCNVNFGGKGGLLTASGTVTYNQDANLLTIDIPVVEALRRNLKPGQHYYVYQPFSLKFWENHPFTLASWTTLQHATECNAAVQHRERFPIDKEADLSTSIPNSDGSDASAPSSISSTSSTTTHTESLTFLVRPHSKSGFTHRLMQQALHSSVTTRLLLEGPYTAIHPLYTYSSVLFIVGGSGVTAAMPYLLEYGASVRQSKKSKQRWQASQVKLVMAARETAMLQHVADKYLGSLVNTEGMQCNLYATSKLEVASSVLTASAAIDKASDSDSSNKAPIDGAAETGISATTTNNPPSSITENPITTQQIQYHHGRPDISTIVQDLVSEGSAAGKRHRMAVFTCGPKSMSTDVRMAVLAALKEQGNGKAEVGYFEEEFGW